MLDSKNGTKRSFDDFKKANTQSNFGDEFDRDLEELLAMSFDFARSNDSNALKTLLDNGLNVNLANHKGDTLLMLASYHGAKESVELLLSFGASVDMANNRGQTPLSGVIFKGYNDIARMLLKSGANINAGIPTPIDCAIMFNRTELLNLMLNGKKLPFFRRIIYFFRRIFSMKR